MDDKELANHLTMLTVTDWSRGTAVDAMRKAASRLRELVAENARLEKQYRERRDVPMANVAPKKPDDPDYYCDQCPHARHLHNPDGSCPCGVNCAAKRLARQGEGGGQ